MSHIRSSIPRLPAYAWRLPLCACIVLYLAGCGFRTAEYEAQARIHIDVQSPDSSSILSNEVSFLHALAGSMFPDKTLVTHHPGTELVDVTVRSQSRDGSATL